MYGTVICSGVSWAAVIKSITICVQRRAMIELRLNSFPRQLCVTIWHRKPGHTIRLPRLFPFPLVNNQRLSKQTIQRAKRAVIPTAPAVERREAHQRRYVYIRRGRDVVSVNQDHSASVKKITDEIITNRH